jgi:hypothetical protein
MKRKRKEERKKKLRKREERKMKENGQMLSRELIMSW